MNANPFSILYYCLPDRVGGQAEVAGASPEPARSSRLWKAVDWIAEVMILAGARLRRASRSHIRLHPVHRDINDNPVPLS